MFRPCAFRYKLIKTIIILNIALSFICFTNVNSEHHSANELIGRPFSDPSYIQEISKRMLATLRKADTVARLGGDEFAVLLFSVEGIEGSKDVAFKLLEEIKQPMAIDGEVHNI
jgi:PleD family two-component response regulator